MFTGQILERDNLPLIEINSSNNNNPSSGKEAMKICSLDTVKLPLIKSRSPVRDSFKKKEEKDYKRAKKDDVRPNKTKQVHNLK